MKPVRILLGALREVREAARWYDDQQRGLGRAFVQEVRASLLEIQSHPERFSRPPGIRVPASIRRYLMPKFSYMLVYHVGDDELLVLAVCHTARRPGYWRKRLRA